jgi:hypothetical protein
MSIVIPRSRSAFSLSKTQAYLKEPFPISFASYITSRVSDFVRQEKNTGGDGARSYLLKFLDGTRIDTTALVDQVTYVNCMSIVGALEGKGEAALPVVVDLPESTWPITTMLMCVFSSLLSDGDRVSDSLFQNNKQIYIFFG